ncbi:unnamed protein product [Lepidochelys kempii]
MWREDEAKKLKFLDCVSTFSRAVLTRSPERNLAAFLSKALLVEKIKTLKAMDEMLKALVCEDQKSNLVVLQNILESMALTPEPINTTAELPGNGVGLPSDGKSLAALLSNHTGIPGLWAWSIIHGPTHLARAQN